MIMGNGVSAKGTLFFMKQLCNVLEIEDATDSR